MRVREFVKTHNVYSNYAFLTTEKLTWELCVYFALVMWGQSRKDTARVSVCDENGKGKRIDVKSEADFLNISESSFIRLSGELSTLNGAKYILFVRNGSDEVNLDIANSYLKGLKGANDKPLTAEEMMHVFDQFADVLEISAFALFARKRIVHETVAKLKDALIKYASSNKSSRYGTCEIFNEEFDIAELIESLEKTFRENKTKPTDTEKPFDMLDVFEAICSPDEDEIDEDF